MWYFLVVFDFDSLPWDQRFVSPLFFFFAYFQGCFRGRPETLKIFCFMYILCTHKSLWASYSKYMRTFQCFIDPLFSSQITYQLHQPNWKLICTLSIYLFSNSLTHSLSCRCHTTEYRSSGSSTHKTILSCLVFSLNI